MRFTRAFHGVLAAFVLATTPALASASPITFAFEVAVSSIDGVATAFPTLSIGDVIAGRYTFDSAAPDANAAAAFGRFDFLASGLTATTSLQIEGHIVSWTGSRIETFNGGVDFYRFQSLGTFLPDPGVGAANFTVQINGPSSALASPALPLTPPNLALFTSSLALIFVETADGDLNLQGTLRSLTQESVAAVPEPASLALLGTGLLIAAARRRRRR